MRASAIVRGGGRHYFYPKEVWSPAGGWWNYTPEGWQRATALAFMGIAAGVALTFRVSAANEVRTVRCGAARVQP